MASNRNEILSICGCSYNGHVFMKSRVAHWTTALIQAPRHSHLSLLPSQFSPDMSLPLPKLAPK